MSRFEGDGDEQFPGEWGLWEGARKRAFASPHGQQKLRELRDALLALPEKKLILTRLVDSNGAVCAMGAMAVQARVDAGEDRARALTQMTPEGPDEDEYGPLWETYEEEQETLAVASDLGVRKSMAIDIAWHNDLHYKETPEQRYTRMLHWVEKCIR